MPLSQDLDASNGLTMCSEAAVFADGCTDLQNYYDTTKPEWFVYGLAARQPGLARALLHATFATIAAAEPAGELKDLLTIAGTDSVATRELNYAATKLSSHEVPLAKAAKKFLYWVITGSGVRGVSVAAAAIAEHQGVSAYGQWLRQQVSFDTWKVGINAQP